MHGPLNYYRTSKIRHEEELGKDLASHHFLSPLLT